jgi:hypothetical protein
VFRLTGGVLAFAGAVLFAVAAWSANRQMTILEKWPEAAAAVESSRVIHSRDSDGDSMYEAEVVFRYHAGGREYVAASRSDYKSSSYGGMSRQVSAFPPGSTHRIKYNPASPADIRHTAGYTVGFFFLPLLAGGMGLICVVVGVAGLWQPGRARRVRCRYCGERFASGSPACPRCGAPPVSAVHAKL